MNLRKWCGLGMVAAALSMFAACGGGGGGGGRPAPTPQVIARVGAVLLGTQPTVIVDPDARGAVAMEVRSDGRIVFAATGEAAWVASIDGAHIHRGAAGTDGAIELDLLSNGALFDPSTRSANDTLFVPPDVANDLADDPSAFYVDLHTAGAPGGLVRAQLVALESLSVWAVLRGGEETIIAHPDARAAVAMTLNVDGSLAWELAVGLPDLAQVTTAAIVEGGPGIDGSVLFDLDAENATANPAAGTLSDQATVPLDVLTRLMIDPSAYHVTIAGPAAPDGLARGQLGQEPQHLWSPLRGDAVTTIVDPAVRGGATIQLETSTRGRVHLAMPPVPPSQFDYAISAVNGAAVREGGPGVDGLVVVDLRSGDDYAVSAPTFSAEGTFALTPNQFVRLLANPAAFYVDLRAPIAPNGLVRGQLGQEPVSFFASLSGAEETNVIDPAAAAVLNPLTFTDIFHCSYSIQVTNPTAGDITQVHIHNGAAGTDGPVLIDLGAAADRQVSGAFITGSTSLTGRTFARLMAYPAGFYVNLHSIAAPNGLARGQCVLLSGDVPPGGLVYADPAPTYTTTIAITPNTPTVSGGAVTSWSISPPLPTGLVLNQVTGILSGTPTEPIAQTDFTVTAMNGAGSAHSIVSITVLLAPPAGLTYATPVSYVLDEAITANTPSSTGGTIASYAISPDLPAGLALDTSTGVLSGTPTELADEASYTVTATNDSGSTQATIVLEVVSGLDPPSSLSYASSPASYPTGYDIDANEPTVTGTVQSWSINPALPAGLSFSTSTGIITGRPTVVTTQTNYTITASNSAGNTQVVIAITTPLGAPSNLAYTNTPAIGYVTGNTFPTMTPSADGGAIASYSVSPDLPPGVTLNTTTGVITGAPTTLSDLQDYTVTATNSAGSTQATIQIVILQ